MSGTEIAIVFVVALLLLGPAKLPGLARSLGKGLREFRRATDDLRSSVESEFYRMDKPGQTPGSPLPRPEVSAPGAAPATEPDAAAVDRPSTVDAAAAAPEAAPAEAPPPVEPNEAAPATAAATAEQTGK